MKRHIFTSDVVLLLLATFFYSSAPMIVNPLITGYALSLHGTEAAAGLAGGIMYLGSLLTRPIAGRLADRISKYRLTMIGLGIMAFSIAGYLIASNVLLLNLWRILSGIGFSLCSIAITTWIAQLFDRDHVGQGMGFYGMITAISMAIAPVIASWLQNQYGIAAAFGCAVLFLLFSLGLIQFVKNRGQQEFIDNSDRHTVGDIFLPSVLPVAFIIMLFSIPFIATFTFIYDYIGKCNPSLNTAMFFPVYAACLLVLRVSLKDQFDKRPFGLFLWLSLISATLFCLCMTFPDNQWILSLAGFFMAGGYGIMCSECQSTAILIAKPSQSGQASSTYYMGIDLGLMIGPMLAGEIMENLPTFFFYPCLAISGLGILLVYLMNRRHLANVH